MRNCFPICFNVLNARETLSLQHEFWKQPVFSWGQVRRIRRMIHGRDCIFMLKIAAIEAKNMPKRCRAETLLRDISSSLLAFAPHVINKPL